MQFVTTELLSFIHIALKEVKIIKNCNGAFVADAVKCAPQFEGDICVNQFAFC